MQETAKINKPFTYNGNSFIKKYRYFIVSILFFIFFIMLYKNTLVEKQINCNSTPIASIFYQPLLKDKMNWEKNFNKLKQANIETLILQWSKFGVVDFIKDEEWLKEILSIANKYDIKVIVGLYGDDKYFKTLENRKTDVEKYLNNLYTQNIQQAEKIYTIAQNYDSFNGYYIYDEIDDTNFEEKSRQKYLKNYLQKMAHTIKGISNHPIYLSGYFSKHMTPTEYSHMITDITQEKYTLLLQSGIGAELVNSIESSQYMKTFSKEFKGSFIPIVEGFMFKNSKIQAIDLLRLKSQINLLKKATNMQVLSLFSLRYFLDDKLFRPYILEYCHTKE